MIMDCYEAFLGCYHIKCSCFEEFEKVCNYLGNKGIRWIDSKMANSKSIYIFRENKYPIWLSNYEGTEKLSWSDSVIEIEGISHRSKLHYNEIVEVVDFNQLTFNNW